MALLRVTLRQRYANQLCINTFDYQSSGTPAAVSLSFALLSALGFVYTGSPPNAASGNLFGQIRANQNDGVQYLEAEARALYSVTDFYTRPFVGTVTGIITNEGQSPALAYGFNTNRVRTDIRRGQKRFVGVDDTTVGEAGVIVTSWLTSMNALAAEMSQVQTYDDEGNTITFSPVILGTEKYVTPEGNDAYRLYPTESAQLSHLATGILWTPKDTVRTQGSRQYNRGS